MAEHFKLSAGTYALVVSHKVHARRPGEVGMADCALAEEDVQTARYGASSSRAQRCAPAWGTTVEMFVDLTLQLRR